VKGRSISRGRCPRPKALTNGEEISLGA
jgi:hypothetical protein